MNNKIRSVMEKALQDKSRGNHQKALERLTDAIQNFPGEPDLYIEAADVCLEAGESIQAAQFLRRAHSKFTAERDRLLTFARTKSIELNDSVLAKFSLDHSIKNRDLTSALDGLQDIKDQTIRELLQRSRNKSQSFDTSDGSHALGGEVLAAAMSEALLCLRLGRMKEAVSCLMQILESKPVENEVLQPFLGELEGSYPKSGRIRYAHACCLLEMDDVDRAMQRFIAAARVEPSVANDCLERIRAYTVKTKEPAENVKHAVVEILLHQGEAARASELLSEELEASPSRATEIIEQVKPHLDVSRESLELHYLYMTAALLAEQTLRVLETLKQIQHDESNRSELLEWLQSRGKEIVLAPEILLVQAELAIEGQDFDQAVEVLKAIADSSPPDIPAVTRVLEKYKASDPRFAEMFTEYAGPGSSSSNEGDESSIEHFESSEFSFSAETAATPSPDPTPSEPTPAPDTDSVLGDVNDSDQVDPDIVATPDTLTGEGGADNADPDFDNFGGQSVFSGTTDAPADDNEILVEDPATAVQPQPPASSANEDDSIVWEEEDEAAMAEAAEHAPPDVPAVTASASQDEGQPEVETTVESSQETEEAHEDEEKVDEGEAESEGMEEAEKEEETRQNVDREDVVVSDAQGAPRAQDTQTDDASDAAPVSGVRNEHEHIDITEAHARNVGDSLLFSGAATFFHVENAAAPAGSFAPNVDTTPATFSQPATVTVGENRHSDAADPNAEASETTEHEVELSTSDVEATADETEEATAEVEEASETTEPETKLSTDDVEATADDVEESEEASDNEQSPADEDDTDEVPVEEEVADEEEETIEEAEPVGAPSPVLSFEERYQQYARGKLENADIVELIQEALDRGSSDKVCELLNFEPDTPAEDFKRRFFHVEYHLLCDRPRPALDLLTAMDTKGLSDEDAQRVGMKTAICHRMLYDFEVAHEVLSQLIRKYPDAEDIRRLAKRNHEELEASKSASAPVLEKTSSLTTDL